MSLYTEASKYIPGGVNSPVRAFRGVGGEPIFFKKAAGAHAWSADGRRFIDYVGSWGPLTLGVPTSPGVPKALANHTVTLNFNDADQVREVFRRIGGQIACVIVEPVAGNMNCVPPAPGFLAALRDECSRAGALLIFDEVMTGFRVALGGAQALYGVRPDL